MHVSTVNSGMGQHNGASTVRDLSDVPVGANGKLGKGFSDPRVKEWTLFVGQIPHQANEYTPWDIFRPFGKILELNILRKGWETQRLCLCHVRNEGDESRSHRTTGWDIFSLGCKSEKTRRQCVFT